VVSGDEGIGSGCCDMGLAVVRYRLEEVAKALEDAVALGDGAGAGAVVAGDWVEAMLMGFAD